MVKGFNTNKEWVCNTCRFWGLLGHEPGSAFYSFYRKYMEDRGIIIKNEDLDTGTVGKENKLSDINKKRKKKWGEKYGKRWSNYWCGE